MNFSCGKLNNMSKRQKHGLIYILAAIVLVILYICFPKGGNSLVLLFGAAGAYGTALMFGTLGEILTEKSGNMNLGVEGIMYMGGIYLALRVILIFKQSKHLFLSVGLGTSQFSPSRVSFSCFAYPLTVSTILGIKSHLFFR